MIKLLIVLVDLLTQKSLRLLTKVKKGILYFEEYYKLLPK